MSILGQDSHRLAQIGRISRKIRQMGESSQVGKNILDAAIDSLEWFTDRELCLSDDRNVTFVLSRDGSHINMRIGDKVLDIEPNT